MHCYTEGSTFGKVINEIKKHDSVYVHVWWQAWNVLPEDNLDETRANCFKHKLKTFFSSSLLI